MPFTLKLERLLTMSHSTDITKDVKYGVKYGLKKTKLHKNTDLTCVTRNTKSYWDLTSSINCDFQFTNHRVAQKEETP